VCAAVGQLSPDVSFNVDDVSFDRTGDALDEDLVTDVVDGVEDELLPDNSTMYVVHVCSKRLEAQ